MFYVYLYVDPNSRQPFYVGKGSKARLRQHLHEAVHQRKTGKPTSPKSRKILELLGENLEPDIIVAFATDDEDLAYQLERKVIHFFGRDDLGQGPLLNLTAGGNGVKARIFTTEQREKCRQRMTGAGPTFGVGHTAEARKRMSISQKARCAAGLVTRHSDEHRQRLRNDNPGGKATARPVRQIYPDGNSRIWPSASSAAKELGLSKGNICLACQSTTRRTGGCLWEYYLARP